MPSVFAIVLGVMLLGAGGWAVVHPNGGYRAVGGLGSGYTPSTRRVWGVALAVLGVVILLFTLT